MNTNDFNRPLSSDALNESLEKAYNVRINFDKYTREQLENYRNLLRTKVHQVENAANFNELLSNEVYQKDKFVLNVLNTRIKEMLGEAKEVVAEKAKSKAQQKFMGMVHAAQKGEKPASKAVAKAAKGMSKKAATDFAKTKHKGLPAHVSESSITEFARNDTPRGGGEPDPRRFMFTTEIKDPTNLTDVIEVGVNYKISPGRKARRPSFDSPGEPEEYPTIDELEVVDLSTGEDITDLIDESELFDEIMQDSEDEHEYWQELGIDPRKPWHQQTSPRRYGSDQDYNEGRTNMNNRISEAKKKAKPDFLDKDKDGNKKEPFKKAVKDAEKKKPVQDDKKKKPAAKKKAVKESIHELRHRAYQNFIAEGLAQLLAEDEEGKAKAITAGADMVNDFTSWMQRVGNYQTKSMIELADNIRANFGVQQAETFKASVGQALEGALNALTTAREEINNAVAVLAGEAPPAEPMGQEPSMGGDVHDLDAASPDAMNLPSMDDEFAASDAAAGGMETSGRMKRESIDRGNRLMKILGA